ncbi:hypothetical protein ACIB24_07210 [Spongisporangium articulatum]|uniref:Secreted protein n=1 Tax=Spongisporangium articulatum TaxID=3362603 RepID=A0ABW8AMI9_9ACTN
MCVLAAVALAGQAGSASAAQVQAPVTRTVVKASTDTADFVRGDKAVGRSKDRVKTFLDDEARRGRLVRTKDVTVVRTDLPDGAGQAMLVTKGEPAEVQFLSRPATSTEPAGFGVVVGGTDSDDVTSSTGGLPADAVVSSSGMTKRGGGCRTVWWDNPWSANDNKLVTCYEKWQAPGTRNWVYNRWALADPAKGNITDFTIRSRPWSGTEGRMDTLDNWAPKPSQSCNNGASATLGYGGASVTVPYIYCSSKIEIYPDSNSNSMGTGWYGSTSDQLQIDFAMAARTYNSSQELTYADYAWLTTRLCGNACQYDNDKYTDPGW